MKKQKNIKTNMLSLKALKAELDQIKDSKSKPTISSQTVTTNAKGSQKVQTTYSFISPFFLVSTLLAYGHKIPFLGKIVKVGTIWYGKTTWFRILVLLRKWFIIMNALIGVYAVFKVTGFSKDNILAGFYGLGHTYLDSLSAFVRGLFNWIVSFLDNKVIPNPPTNPSNPAWKILGNTDNTLKPSWWSMNRPKVSTTVDDYFSLRELYKDSTPKSSWFGIEIPSWVWYIGAGIICVGAIYAGYTIYSDFSHYHDMIFNRNGNRNYDLANAQVGGTALNEMRNAGPSNLGDTSDTNTTSTVITYLGDKFSTVKTSITSFGSWTYGKIFGVTESQIPVESSQIPPFKPVEPSQLSPRPFNEALYGVGDTGVKRHWGKSAYTALNGNVKLKFQGIPDLDNKSLVTGVSPAPGVFSPAESWSTQPEAGSSNLIPKSPIDPIDTRTISPEQAAFSQSSEIIAPTPRTAIPIYLSTSGTSAFTPPSSPTGSATPNANSTPTNLTNPLPYESESEIPYRNE